MNESILEQLKILVERVVRPMRASITRKRKIREELLAHVVAVFEDEATHGDESAALAQTAQRFGPPEELTRQLQAEVHWKDVLAYCVEKFVGTPTHEPVIRRAARYAGLVAVFVALFLVGFMFAKGQWQEWTSVARLPTILAPIWLAGLTIWGTVLEHYMRQALFGATGRSWCRAIGVAVASWLFLPCLVLAWSVAVTSNVMFSLLDTWPLFLLGLLAPVVLLIIVYACIEEIRYLDEWASLKID